jgi:hypothetical protein
VFVAFLDLQPGEDGGGSVNGVCVPVGATELARLDRRERNYVRIDVSDRIAAAGARVWAYAGSPDGRARLHAGRQAGTAFIAAAYLRGVEAAFAALGDDEHRRCRPSLAPGGLPVAELIRHELP